MRIFGGFILSMLFLTLTSQAYSSLTQSFYQLKDNFSKNEISVINIISFIGVAFFGIAFLSGAVYSVLIFLNGLRSLIH